MAAANAAIAVVAKLKASALSVGARVYPQSDTQESVLPVVLVSMLGITGSHRLSGASSALRACTVRVDCYAVTEVAAKALGKQVRDALATDGTPWTSTSDGVQGCFFLDSTDDITDDGIRVQQETFSVWHTPT